MDKLSFAMLCDALQYMCNAVSYYARKEEKKFLSALGNTRLVSSCCALATFLAWGGTGRPARPTPSLGALFETVRAFLHFSHFLQLSRPSSSSSSSISLSQNLQKLFCRYEFDLGKLSISSRLTDRAGSNSCFLY